MKFVIKGLGAAGLLALAACGQNADDKAAENIEAMTENRADQLEAQADAAGNEQVEDALEDRAENVSEMGEEAAEKADDSDDARVENQVANAL
ncbi:hypothetical protein [Sphingomonas lenta]|uniref:Lipoprotein n=1 Tax=Sphingomonas lenta TaxID=1141887 RepID=A0A2A2SCY0_9SPHN|nr:hypothetical protein [Sphingomonas lenta]PAX06861.1 hypothetical protein CKY28_12340 [Sphingomonas lenta]